MNATMIGLSHRRSRTSFETIKRHDACTDCIVDHDPKVHHTLPSQVSVRRQLWILIQLSITFALLLLAIQRLDPTNIFQKYTFAKKTILYPRMVILMGNDAFPNLSYPSTDTSSGSTTVHHHKHSHSSMKKNSIKSTRRLRYPMSDMDTQAMLLDSDEYNRRRVDKVMSNSPHCHIQYPWQLTSFPNANTIHEMDLVTMTLSQKTRILAHGYWRDVWVYPDSVTDSVSSSPFVILKTQRYEHDYTERNLDRHRRDALIMERATASDFVLDIYAFAAGTGVFEWGDGGDIEHALWPQHDKDSGSSSSSKDTPQSETNQPAFHSLSPLEKLQIGKVVHELFSLYTLK
jgi:hypothetical protein